jgi:hypothetical protein
MIYRDNAIDVPTRRVWSIGHTRYAILALNLSLATYAFVWNSARIRSQPPERIVRVLVQVPGPERIVRDACLDSMRTVDVGTMNDVDITCHSGGIARTSQSGRYVVLECHCPRTP